MSYDRDADPFAGLEMIATSAPQVATWPLADVHRVKLATTVRRGRAILYAWECVCDFSSALHESERAANDAYIEHKGERAA